MRIALTHAFCRPEVRRGAERFLPELGAALARRGHVVVHFSSAWEAGKSVEEGVRTVRLRRLFKNQYRHEADFGRRLLPLLASRRFDIVHSLGRHDAAASVMAARLHPHRRTVMTDLGLPNPASWERIGKRDARAARRAVDGIDIYGGMSKAAVDALAQNYGREDGVVIPGGVDMSSFAPSPEREPVPTILFSGAVDEPRKGVPTLLDALPKIAASEPEVELWLSGPGSAEEFLSKADPDARRRTKVLGLGESSRQHERYGRAWITCLPSMHDSFGMAMLESLACGTPLVASTHAAPQDMVSAGVTGELCEPQDADSLAHACLRAFELTRKPETTTKCRDSAKPYDWDEGLAPLCESFYLGRTEERISSSPSVQDTP